MEQKKQVEGKSNLNLDSRKALSLTGVLEVISFDEIKISLNTNVGMLIIKGSDLKMNKLDVQNGDVVVVGRIDSFMYTGSPQKNNNESILSKLFR